MRLCLAAFPRKALFCVVVSTRHIPPLSFLGHRLPQLPWRRSTMAAVSLAPTRRLASPLVRSNTRRVLADGIGRQSAGVWVVWWRRVATRTSGQRPTRLASPLITGLAVVLPDETLKPCQMLTSLPAGYTIVSARVHHDATTLYHQTITARLHSGERIRPFCPCRHSPPPSPHPSPSCVMAATARSEQHCQVAAASICW